MRTTSAYFTVLRQLRGIRRSIPIAYCLPVRGVVSGATAAGLLQLSTGRHSVTPCSALAVSDERGCTARLLVIKVQSHHAAPTPTTQADDLLADRLQTGRSCL